MAVSFLYAMRRVNCPTCGVKVEQVPWADGKSHLTKSYRWFLARLAQRLSWKGVADVFHTTWENVFRSVKYAVLWGLVHRDVSGIEALGVDEIQWQPRAQIPDARLSDRRRPQAAVVDRRRANRRELAPVFRTPQRQRRTGIRFVCSDMWKPYLKVVREELGQAVHVLDRFHIMKKMNEAIDQVRREEVPRLDAGKIDLAAKGIHRRDRDFAVAWAKDYGKGRVLYNGLGHTPDVWERPGYQRMWLEMVQWALGISRGDATPRPAP